MGGGGSLQRRPGPTRESFAIAHPPPNVTGELHLGHALQLSLAGHDRPHAADAGLQRPLPAGLRPRRHLDAGRGREASRARGKDAPGPRPRSVRGARLGVARASTAARSCASSGASARRSTTAASASRWTTRTSRAVMRFFVHLYAQGLDLPREPDHQLVPVPPDVALGPRGRARRGRRHAHLRPLSARRRRRPHHDRDRAPRDDPRRRRRRRASRTTSATATSSAARWSCRTSSGACR